MFNKNKCSSCAKKLEKNHNFCPFCGASTKEKKEKQNYGLLGRHDTNEPLQPEVKLPFGLEKMMGGLLKQLEKQMNNGQLDPQNMPKGFNIRVTTGKPTQQTNKTQQLPKKQTIQKNLITQEERQRRQKLPKIDAKSKIKRLGDKIIYEIETPDIEQKQNVVLTKLASGIEVKAYGKKKCYIKNITLNADLQSCYIKNNKVYVEFKTE